MQTPAVDLRGHAEHLQQHARRRVGTLADGCHEERGGECEDIRGWRRGGAEIMQGGEEFGGGVVGGDAGDVSGVFF